MIRWNPDQGIIKNRRKYRTFTLTCNLSLVNGAAFITNPSQDLTSYLGYKITLNDGTQNLIGWIKAAGIVENVSSELLSNPGFDSDTVWLKGAGWSIAGGVATVGAPADSSITQVVSLTVGHLLKETFDLTAYTAGTPQFYNAGMTPTTKTTTMTLDTKTRYMTVTAGGNRAIGCYGGTASVWSADNRSTKQVLIPSATGVTIVSAQGGSAYNWTSDGGIDPNAASFTATITLS